MNLNIKVLAPKEHDDNRDYGDCFIINDNGKVIVYDCGSEELAEMVLDYLNTNGIDKIDVILSHNDEDHFNGIPKLIEANVVNSITTLLLLKYVKRIKEKVNDDRVTEDSIKRHILEMYSNISKLSGQNLIDALEQNNLSPNVKIVGPSENYFINAVAKQFTPSESDNIDKSTIMNAISVQLEVNIENKKLLLTGDADVAAFDDKLTAYDGIQLPHHGNSTMAESIFEINEGNNEVLYIVSDNKGKNVNGGSDELNTKGHHIINTKTGTLDVDYTTFTIERTGNLFCNEIYFDRQKH